MGDVKDKGPPLPMPLKLFLINCSSLVSESFTFPIGTSSIKNIKTALWKGYSELFEKLNAKDKVISILKKQGKVNLMNLLKSNNVDFETILNSRKV